MQSLDLHGTKHEDVKRRVIRFIEDNWGTNKDVEIITGHSERMKWIVSEVLNEYKLSYIEGTKLNYSSSVITVLNI